MGRRAVIALKVVRVLAWLAILFGVAAAASSFESTRGSGKYTRGGDMPDFWSGLLVLLGLKDPADADMTPVWWGRLCVVVGIALVVGISVLLRRKGELVSTPPRGGPPPG